VHGFIVVSRVGTDLCVCPFRSYARERTGTGTCPYGVLFAVDRHAISKQWSAATSTLGHWKFLVGYWIFSLFSERGRGSIGSTS
jgi:hypothetical protein